MSSANGPSAPSGANAKSDPPGVCVAICNHWSYIGIGWQLGIESCVLSALDAMEVADREPHLRTCLNLDARAYEFMAETYPEVVNRLKKYLKSGKVELIGCTYGQPMGTTVGGESNIRQIVVGREVVKRVLGYDVATFLEEEEFTHPQLPQLLVGSGFNYASLAQCDTWGIAGIPTVELNSVNWQGLDGATIPTTPKNAMFRSSLNMDEVVVADGFKKLRAMGPPLIMTWEEFGWESDERPAYTWIPDQYRDAAKNYPMEFVTLKEYMDKYGAKPEETVFLPMDAFDKKLTWGLGGDQVRIYDRKIEGTLQAAETFNAFASTLGRTAKVAVLDQAWKDMMAGQSHDVALCEYSRWQAPGNSRMARLDRVEDKHNFTWGAIGYNHMDAAMAAGKQVLEGALKHIAASIAPRGPKADRVLTVFNPLAWDRTGVATTGRIYPLPAGTKDVAIVDRNGQTVPSQLAVAEHDAKGNLVVADVAFLAASVPSIGYEAYGLNFLKKAATPVKTSLQVDEKALTIENAHLRVAFDGETGTVKSLLDKHTRKEMLREGDGRFPVLRGRPSDTYPLHSGAPECVDSSQSKAQLTWIENGPVRATLRARHKWPYIEFETFITLTPESRSVEALSRLLSDVPPRANSNQNEYIEGFWLTFGPAAEPGTVVRDYPLGVEKTTHKGFHALTFADLNSKVGGLLALHDGAQWFQIDDDGLVKNLIVREWESYFSLEWGFPRYCEYRNALQPHGAGFTSADRLRASSEFARPLLTVLGKPGKGELPQRHSFLSVSSSAAQVLAFRKKANGGFELRVVETEGKSHQVQATIAVPGSTATQTDLLGRPIAGAAWQEPALRFELAPWKVLTFEVT